MPIDEIRNFVINGYIDVLLREPEDDGLNHYINAINSGLSREDFINALKNSEESRDINAFVTRAYRRILLREPDDAGLNHYINAINAGLPKTDFINTLKDSEEFRTSKKVAVIVVNSAKGYDQFRNDQYDTFRSEGRYPLNIGLGLGSLGFKVNIIFNEWKIDVKKAWDNVYLSKRPVLNHYNYVLVFSNIETVKDISSDKVIFMGYTENELGAATRFANDTGRDMVFTCPWAHYVYGKGGLQERTSINIRYLPGLYPIPSINMGYLPYGFDKSRSQLKLYIFCGSWKGSTSEYLKYLHKEELIINFLKNKGYDVKLYLHIESEDIKDQFPLKGDAYLFNNKSSYLDVINFMKSVDMYVTIGSRNVAGLLPDIVSMGKPFIFISDGILGPNDNIYSVNIFSKSEELLYMQESDEKSLEKLQRFISNPEDIYNKFRDAYKDSNFENWKEHAGRIFEK